METEIKLLIKNTVFNVSEWSKFQSRVDDIVVNGLRDVDNEGLASIIDRTIREFARNEWGKIIKYFDFGSLPLIVGLSGAIIELKGMQENINNKINEMPVRRIEGGFTTLASSTPKVENRQSLYGYAEMQGRYNEQKEMLRNLKAKTKLVVCDTHSNCSDRCFKWQGRVYSLDGTTGITSDGRRYVPLEEATQARDKYGNINGLLGYNCRHKLVEYKDGLQSPKVTKAEQRKQYDINMEQRLYENKIRDYKQKAELSVIKEDKDRYRRTVKDMTNKYKSFCKENGVVEYRSRLKV